MVDLSFLEKFTKGNEAKIKRYINMYLSIAPEIFERMALDIQNQNWADLAINAHSLKPQADFMGIADLKAILIQIEDGVKDVETSKLDEFYQQALQIHQKAEIQLKDHVNHL